MHRLFIHATNVHLGGGGVLLNDLLRAIAAGQPAVALLDERMNVHTDVPAHVEIKRVRPSIASRLSAEAWLSRQVEACDQVLCFGNLPPLFRLRGDVSVFLQNRYLVDDHAPLRALPPKAQIRLRMERAWLMSRRANARRYFVQTPSMQRLAESRLGVPVTCAPFVPEDVLGQAAAPAGETPLRFDFLYVASGEAHKNHDALLGAWTLLAAEGIFPTLALTLSQATAPDLVERITTLRQSKQLRIHNLGVLPHERLVALYRESKALIYPSGFESFGLPLLEAKMAGLAVLAPELDYVRDVIDPEQTFDPGSRVSIARAVKRFLQGCPPPVQPVGVKAFLERLDDGAAS